MNQRLSELEKAALINDADGNIALNITPAADGATTPAPSVRLSQLQRDAFVLDSNGNIAVRVTGETGGGSCTIESGISTTSVGWDASGSLSRNFNIDNTGFQWDLLLGNAQIIALCENTLVTPLPTITPGMGALSVSSITLAGTDITSSVTVDTSTENTIKLNYDTQIVNPNLTSSNTFEIKLNLLLGTETLPELTRTLTYNLPLHNVSITRANVGYDNTYTTANISRSNPNGAPTSTTSTVFGGTTETAGATSITFTALNRQSSQVSRTLVDTALFTNATNSSQTRSIATTAILSPAFFFPVYLGNVTSTEAAGLTAALLNMSSRFLQSGTFVSRPNDQTYTWPANTVAAQTDRIFAVRSSFTNGADITVRSAPGAFPSIISRNSQLALGTISGNTENYDVYIVQVSSPGSGSLFIEL